MKQYLISEKELEELEVLRVGIHRLVDSLTKDMNKFESNIVLFRTMEVTQPMWSIIHKHRKEIL